MTCRKMTQKPALDALAFLYYYLILIFWLNKSLLSSIVRIIIVRNMKVQHFCPPLHIQSYMAVWIWY